jgi:hypothetical protein
VSQPALPGLETTTLTARQELALTLIRELGPLNSQDLGWRLRELRGGRPSGAEFDQSNGRAVGDALARKGLVRYVRGEGWVSNEYAPEPTPSAQLGPDEDLPY